MKYWVFTAANIPENELAIKMAVHTVSILDDYWDMNAVLPEYMKGVSSPLILMMVIILLFVLKMMIFIV